MQSLQTAELAKRDDKLRQQPLSPRKRICNSIRVNEHVEINRDKMAINKYTH